MLIFKNCGLTPQFRCGWRTSCQHRNSIVTGLSIDLETRRLKWYRLGDNNDNWHYNPVNVPVIK